MGETARELLRQTIYSAIRLRIVTGQLPPGARIIEAELAEQLDVSRTPIREALHRLERDGLVVSRPRSGFAVSPFDSAEARNAFDLREVLELHAVTRATARIDDVGRVRLREIVRECDALAELPSRSRAEALVELQLGLDLHRVIAEESGNPMLSETLGRVLDRCQAWIWMDLTRLDHWGAAREDHARIVDAICRGDIARAREEMEMHLSLARANVLRLVDMHQEIFALAQDATTLDKRERLLA